MGEKDLSPSLSLATPWLAANSFETSPPTAALPPPLSLLYPLEHGPVLNLAEPPPIRAIAVTSGCRPTQSSRHPRFPGCRKTMPSFSSDAYQSTTTATATHPRSFDSPRKSHDKSSVGNTFLWTNWPNGDANHDPPQNDRQLLTNLKNGSAYSLNGPRSSAGSYTRDLPHSKDGSMHSLANGSARDPRDGGRPSAMLDRKSSDAGPGAGFAAASVPSSPANGTATWNQRSPQGKAMANGDIPRPSADEPSDRAISPSTSLLQIPHADDTGRLSPEPAKPSHHRYSSPPAPSAADMNSTQDSQPSSMRHRHSLQVPRAPSARRNSRDYNEDTAYSSGRLSPTTGSVRRTSFGMMRRTKTTTQSDGNLGEALPDDEAARWAEAIRQRRASRRRREDEDDERVIVGTKVDQNHVNYVTAYNMLTGIRFTVSRINAKMDRELTPADFAAKHKFSFDMYGSSYLPRSMFADLTDNR